MEIKLYNSLGKKVQEFKPIKDKEVSLYVCGITPYDTTHLGHAFTYLSFDVLVRLLKFHGYKVNYTQNVTDIDDDILKRAARDNRDWQELGDFWTEKFLSDMNALNWVMPDPYVKASDAIPAIIKIVSSLLEKGFAYEVKGTVYFVSRSEIPLRGKVYGQLSGFNREEMIKLSRERGADPDDPNKRDALDFVMWQAAKEGEPSWVSPFGQGRPGWHIECSAMIYDNLGPQIDIHGGGEDLIYPHHESEIAQSESFTNKSPFASVWMHTASVYYKSEKMSKSLGNLIMISSLLQKYSVNAIRFLLLSHHYRIPWEFEESAIEQAQTTADMLDAALRSTSGKTEINKEYFDKFIGFLNDDLQTPQALELVSEIANKMLKEEEESNSDLKATLASCLNLLGFKV